MRIPIKRAKARLEKLSAKYENGYHVLEVVIRPDETLFQAYLHTGHKGIIIKSSHSLMTAVMQLEKEIEESEEDID